MSAPVPQRPLSVGDMEAILGVTRALAAPFDLTTMLGEVVGAAKQVLRAERGSVWLYDAAADELVLEVATGIRPVRVRSGIGLVGACARSRQIINVPDCYADPRFDPGVDKTTGYRTRCMLTLPLVDHNEVLVGVMQVLNKADGVFDAYDEALATALAAQCAVALQRVRMIDALIDGERMRHGLEMAREVQMSTLPAAMPSVPSYDVGAAFRPAELTGGDTYDVALQGDRLLVMMGDATGHGIAPALSVTQMQAMLRMAFRLGADLDTAFLQVNNRLAETLPDDRFITAFIGLLDPGTHELRFHSGGQGPILHYQAATGTWASHRPTSFPMGAMPLSSLRPAVAIRMLPGDILAVVSDGIFEYQNPQGEQFGERRVREAVHAHRAKPTAELVTLLLQSVEAFAGAAPQEDDMTAVLLKRDPARPAQCVFERSFESIPALVAFSADAFAHLGIDLRLLPTVDLAVEELFTNMVKYGVGSDAGVIVGIAAIEGGVEVTLVDRDVEPFDVTRAPAVDINAPIEERRPGGLGLHLIRQMVDSIEYEYKEAERCSRTTLRLTVGDPD
ncbi:MAG TPA: SpoIIE family protein phosphatase [Casimicrobiaceae bacterium]|nr:SpoIIE family protein phosphatase [Casimicrobiaceae bacterium]